MSNGRGWAVRDTFVTDLMSRYSGNFKLFLGKIPHTRERSSDNFFRRLIVESTRKLIRNATTNTVLVEIFLEILFLERK